MPLDDDRMPTLQGRYKVPHFDAQGRGRRGSSRAGVPTTFLLTVVLLGQPHLLRRSARSAAPTASSRSRSRWATRSCRGSRRRTSARRRYGDLQARPELHRQDGGHRRRAPVGHRAGGRAHAGARRGGRLQRRRPGRLPQLRLPGRGRDGEHVPVQARLRGRLRRRARACRSAGTRARPAGLRDLARGQQGPHPMG